ncbi:MAG: response regulator [Caulobacter sp.]|nr:response regulator [Caulobacter sp.]
MSAVKDDRKHQSPHGVSIAEGQAAFTNALQLMAGNAPLPIILGGLVRCLEILHPGVLASILLLDEAGQHLRFAAGPSLPDDYNQAIDGVTIGPNVGSCGTAAFLNQTVIAEDIQTSPLWVEFKDLAGAAGLASCWSEPVRGSDGRVLGTLAMYRREVRAPSIRDMDSMTNAAQLVAITIERKAAEEALVLKEQTLRLAVAEAKAAAEKLADAREEARRQENFQSTIIQMLPAVLVVKNARDGRFALINPAAEAATGLKAENAIGKTVDDLFPPDEAERSWAEDRLAIESGKMLVEHDAPVTTRDRGPRYWTTRKVVTHDDNGPAFIVTVGEDVTERHEAQIALTAALKTAEEANRAKSAFLANMSHELRTPLNGIVAAADLLARRDLGEEERELLDLIRTSGATLTGLLSDLLDMAQIEAGAVKIENEPFDLAAMARSTVELFSQRGVETGVSLELDIAPEIAGWRRGDALRVRQILTNFLSNALKFTAAGSIAVAIHPTADGRVRLSVKDTGTGFEPEAKARVFGRFQQADDSITRRFGGTGLGLAICSDLAALMGGAIDCESQPGVGSTFWVDLPLVAVNKAADVPTAAVPANDLPQRSLRVLVADDHPTNRKVAELMLADLAEVVSVVDGQQAVDAALRTRFDLVLMDMQMPVMDGLTAVRRIRASGAPGHDAPIVMMTANALPEHLEASRLAGADVHLPKPITAATLMAAVNEAFAAREAAANDDAIVQAAG